MTRLAALLLALSSVPVAAAVRFALVVGNNVGGPEDRPLKWAEADAQRVHRLLIELGGVDEPRAALLAGSAPKAVELGIARLSGEVAEARRRGERTEVFVYYSGHGDSTSLHLGDEQLPRASLQAWLEAVPADVVLTFIDACRTGPVRSGSPRGLSHAPAFDVRFARQAGLQGRVVIESAGSDEFAQESDDLEGGFFTHQLLTGLRGAADSDGDKRVSVAEAYHYAYHRTLSSSFAAEGAQHPSMSADFEGEGELVVTSLERSGARMRLQPSLAGELLIVDDATARVVVELRMSGGAPLELALPVGDYRLIRRDGARVWAGKVRLLWQRTETVAAEALSEQPRMAALQRGTELDPAPWRLWAGAVVARPRALLSGVGGGARLGLERRIGGPMFVALRLGAGTAQAVGGLWDTRHIELSVGPALGVQVPFGLVRLACALSVELVSIFSSARHLQEERLKSASVGPTRADGWTLGPALGAEAWLGLTLPASFELRLGGGVSVAWVRYDGRVQEGLAPFAQASVVWGF